MFSCYVAMLFKNTCPLNGNCLQWVIYQATVKRNDNNTSETYIGLTENALKTRYRNYTASFRHTKHRNSTELSKHVWSLKDNNIGSSYNSSSKRCNLCLKENFGCTLKIVSFEIESVRVLIYALLLSPWKSFSLTLIRILTGDKVQSSYSN